LPKERPFVVETSDGLPFGRSIAKRGEIYVKYKNSFFLSYVVFGKLD
jgi:hypothetical protein